MSGFEALAYAVAGLFALGILGGLIVLAAAVRFYLSDRAALKNRVEAVSLDADAWMREQAAGWEREVWVPRVVETTAHVYALSDWRRDGAA